MALKKKKSGVVYEVGGAGNFFDHLDLPVVSHSVRAVKEGGAWFDAVAPCLALDNNNRSSHKAKHRVGKQGCCGERSSNQLPLGAYAVVRSSTLRPHLKQPALITLPIILTNILPSP